MVVDDIKTNLLVVKGLLRPFAMQIDLCLSGEEALAKVKEHDYDLIFMDHMMPEMDGIETTRRIRELDGERFQRVPIIALTANAIAGMKEMFLENGMNDFLSKPIETGKMNAMLLKWIAEAKREKIPDTTGEEKAPG
jgi:CheY-like chemotaxis protein